MLDPSHIPDSGEVGDLVVFKERVAVLAELPELMVREARLSLPKQGGEMPFPWGELRTSAAAIEVCHWNGCQLEERGAVATLLPASARR